MSRCKHLTLPVYKLLFGTILFTSFLMLAVWFVVMDGSIIKYTHISLDNTSRASEFTGRINCIEENICKSPIGEEYYVYRRNEKTFKQMLSSSVDTNRKIIHNNRVIPPLVHFTWYGGTQKNHFRFHHLLSVLAVQKFVKPKRIFLWFDLIPEGDHLIELQDKVPQFIPVYRKSPKQIYGWPVSTPELISDIIRLEAVLEYGGMYFDLDVIVVKPLDPLLKYEVVMGYESAGRLCNGIIIAVKWPEFLKMWHKQYKTFDDKDLQFHSCEVPAVLAKNYPQLIHTEEKSLHRPNPTEVNQLYEVGNLYDWRTNNYAMRLWIEQHKIEHNPTDIKTWNTTVGAIFRYIYYGNSAITTTTPQPVKQISTRNSATTTPQQISTRNKYNNNLCLEINICKEGIKMDYYTYNRNDTFNKLLHSKINFNHDIEHKERVIPSLVHFTWYGGKQKNQFRFHHMLAVLAAHTFIKPARIFLWIDMVPEGNYFEETRQKVPELYLIHRETPTQIYGRPVKVSEHHTDIVRLEAVLEYGGIYLDLDTMVVKPLDSLLNYEVVMGYEHENGLCNGVIIAVAWADFLKIWHLEYKSFQDKQWAEHSVHLPAVLARKHKNLIHTEERSFHRPNWEDNDLRQLYEVGQIYDWKTNNYIVHLWIRKHGIEHNPEDIKTWNTTVGQIFRYIYYGRINCIEENICKSPVGEEYYVKDVMTKHSNKC
ncbi:uncharacterized protein LOC121380399 [Gigantopelta aegis]|uniref:uncharacterized protein LOC121380399 n=1 Tax=Gigantopelta aegis TaxID=1735272 RepID=UPI001B88AA33|nr:uncharacterized protein LOC121380399 [Gigantopelta aegis]